MIKLEYKIFSVRAMFQGMHPTPDISHITREDYKDVYELSEDSFLFMDALEKDANLIKKLK